MRMRPALRMKRIGIDVLCKIFVRLGVEWGCGPSWSLWETWRHSLFVLDFLSNFG